MGGRPPWWPVFAQWRVSFFHDPNFSADRRPLLVVQSDSFNQSKIGTVIAVVLTSNTKLAKARGNVLLTRRVTGLPKDSVANVSQVITVDKTFLTKLVGFLPAKKMQQVEDGLRLALYVSFTLNRKALDLSERFLLVPLEPVKKQENRA